MTVAELWEEIERRSGEDSPKIDFSARPATIYPVEAVGMEKLGHTIHLSEPRRGDITARGELYGRDAQKNSMSTAREMSSQTVGN